MRITLGPALFNWPAEKWRDFYFRIADEADVDAVCLGEVVCAKRQPFTAPHLPEVAERLARGGKEVIFSSLALVMNRAEREAVAAVCEMSAEAPVEVNDISALAHVRGRPHVIGPMFNIYGEATVRYLSAGGARRMCLPPELDATAIAALTQAARAAGAETEVFAFGRMPLAISARCYHARVCGLSKDSCQFVCERDPDGMALRTLDGEPFLAVNGVQTLSHACMNLAGETAALKDMGVAAIRLSPQTCDMPRVAEIFRGAIRETLSGAEARAALAELGLPFPFANGYFHGRPGAEWTAADATDARPPEPAREDVLRRK